MLSWRHTGFNVHSRVRTKSKEEAERVGKMLVIAFIEDPKIIDKIIKDLKLSFHAERPPLPHNVHQELLIAAEEKREWQSQKPNSYKLENVNLLIHQLDTKLRTWYSFLARLGE